LSFAQRVARFKIIHKLTPPQHTTRTILTGDFNHPASGEGVLDLTTNTVSMHFKKLADTFDDIFSLFHDVTNDQYTRAMRSLDGRNLKLSRIDRTLDNLPTTYLRDRHPTLRQLWPATTTTAISDHTPIIYTCNGHRHANTTKTPCIPRWIAEHVRYPTILKAIMENKRPRHDVTAQHLEDKSSMLAAALELRNTLHEDTAHNSDVQLALSIQAARAHQSNNLTSLSQAIRAYPKLLKFFDGPHLHRPQQLHEHIQQLANTTRDQKLQELEKTET